MTKKPLIGGIALIGVFLAGEGRAQDATLEIPESTLNRVIRKMDVLSDGGIAQPYSVAEAGPLFEECIPIGFVACSGIPERIPGFGGDRISLVVCRKEGGGVAVLPQGDPVSWQWWISDARLEVDSGQMTFTATVTTHVGDDWETVTRSVGASVQFDGGTNRLQLDIEDFSVELRPDAGTVFRDVEPVDVARFFSIAIPIVPQQFSVRMPDGTSKSVTGRVAGITAVRYLQDALEVTFDVDF